MVRLNSLPEITRGHIRDLDCPTFDSDPWVSGPPLAERTIAIISTAGLIRRGEPPFRPGSGAFAPIANDTPEADLLSGHISVNFDRTGYHQDRNIAMPIERMNELAGDGVIGAVAKTHYSSMGATDPRKMVTETYALAEQLKADGVDTAILIPV